MILIFGVYFDREECRVGVSDTFCVHARSVTYIYTVPLGEAVGCHYIMAAVWHA
jgi:hypothetical protein